MQPQGLCRVKLDASLAETDLAICENTAGCVKFFSVHAWRCESTAFGETSRKPSRMAFKATVLVSAVSCVCQ